MISLRRFPFILGKKHEMQERILPAEVRDTSSGAKSGVRF